MSVKYFKSDKPFILESGESLDGLTIAYHTYGQHKCDNVVWVCHALTANSDVADWWPHTVEQDRFLDPERYFVVCANILGSHYGTTGPLSTNPKSGKPYYIDFPFFTIRDMAAAHFLLAEHLGIERVRAAIGSSIGGFQAMEMSLLRPEFIDRLVLIATSASAMPWTIGFNESQRMAIEADPTFFAAESDEGGHKGLAAARSIGLLSYRGSSAYNITQREDMAVCKTKDFRVSSYQRYQGEKLCKRYNAYSYYLISKAFDSHNIGRDRGSIEKALSMIESKTMIVGISSDILFPLEDQEFLKAHIPDSEMQLIDSEFGHDGFLVEHDKLNAILNPFIES